MITVRRMLCLVSCVSFLYFFKTAADVPLLHADCELIKDRQRVLASRHVTMRGKRRHRQGQAAAMIALHWRGMCDEEPTEVHRALDLAAYSQGLFLFDN